MVALTADDKTTVSFSSLLGQGVIYNVIVWDPSLNTSAAYVPVHTYACSLESVNGSCVSPGEYVHLNPDTCVLGRSVSASEELKIVQKCFV